MTLLNLTNDELLSTTRSVRKRLDLERPVARSLVEECLQLAIQAPSGSNRQDWHFIIVNDPAKKLALAEVYRKGWAVYSRPFRPPTTIEESQTTLERMRSSAAYLAEHMHEVPWMVIPCVEGRLEDNKRKLAQRAASVYGSILPAAWSFMLAARARGLGTCWTTLHLMNEEEAAAVLGIPYDRVTQVALIPVAYTKGTEFKPAPRKPLTDVLHVDGW